MSNVEQPVDTVATSPKKYIATMGQWHLGTVTTACLAQAGYTVIAYDRDETIIHQLQERKLPVDEPGLSNLIYANPIQFTNAPHDLAMANLIWVTYDTPVDDHDEADVDFVKQEIYTVLPYLNQDTLILISSQLPVGTTQALQCYADDHFPDKKLSFAYSPENLRLGKAIDIFMHPDRIVIGVGNEHDKSRLYPLLSHFSEQLIWMSVPSAEMTKHALNAFLATSVVFANELGTLCEHVGADAREVERGLKSEIRIGQRAYLKAGQAFAGGTLARDVIFLQQLCEQYQPSLSLFDAVLNSNQQHKQWVLTQIQNVFPSVAGKQFTLLGLTYKPGTNTLRRSSAIELAQALALNHAYIVAYDPAIQELPDELNFITLCRSAEEALHDANAAIITTEWPEFSALSADSFINQMKTPFVFDTNAFLGTILENKNNIHYYRVGKKHETDGA